MTREAIFAIYWESYDAVCGDGISVYVAQSAAAAAAILTKLIVEQESK